MVMVEIQPVADDVFGRLYRLPNNYGASAVPDMKDPDHPGAWEVAVIKWWETENGSTWETVYTTPVTDDIVRCGSEGDLQRVLRQIASLPDAQPGSELEEEVG